MPKFKTEPYESTFENGNILPDDELAEPTTDKERYEALDRLVESGEANVFEARARIGLELGEHAAAIAARNLIEPERTSEEVDTAERLVTVEQRFGFIPRSRRELNDTYDITGKELVAGSATHLNIVLNRQKKYMDDPDRTVRAIVGRYAGYAKRARGESAFLTQLQDEVTNERGTVDTSKLNADWQFEPSQVRPLVHVLWSQRMTAFTRDDASVNPLVSEEDDNYKAANKETFDAIDKLLSKKTLFSEELAHSIKSEKGRYEFWINALQDARRHKAAAGVAYQALLDLGVLKKEELRS